MPYELFCVAEHTMDDGGVKVSILALGTDILGLAFAGRELDRSEFGVTRVQRL